MPACSSGARRIERPRTEAAGTASRSAPWTAARGGAIIVRESRGERATRAGVQGVIGDLLLPSRSARRVAPGRDVVDGHHLPLVLHLIWAVFGCGVKTF